MRVNAAGRRQGVKGLRDEGIQVETLREVEGGRWEGFWILDFAPRLRDTLTRGFWMGKGTKKVTIMVYIPMIYIVNTSLQSKYYKIFINL